MEIDMTDTEAMRAILAKAVTTEDDCQYYSMSQPFERTSEAHNFLRTYMKAAPAMLDEIDALRAENARLREVLTRIADAVESSLRPKEGPHRMVFADGHIETGRAVDASFRMMQKMQDAVRAALTRAPSHE
jgi:hypothetical protein